MIETEEYEWLISHGYDYIQVKDYQILVQENSRSEVENNFSKFREKLGQLQDSGGRGSRHCQFELPGLGSVFLKQYHHGGLLAGEEDTAYRSPRRFLRELKATTLVREGPGKVPPPLGVITTTSAAGVKGYYFSIALAAQPVSKILRGRKIKRDYLREAGQLLARIHRAGIDPLDFHIDNLLVNDDQELYAVDFDPVKFRVPSAKTIAFRLHRFARSLTKNGFSKKRVQSFKAGYEAEWGSFLLSFWYALQKPFWSLKNRLSDLIYWGKQREISELETEKILVRGPNWIGDVMMSLPLLQRLKEKYPESDLDIVARDSVAAIYQHSPVVRKVWELKEKTYSYPPEVVKEEYSALVVLPKSWRTGLQAGRSGIPRRFGFATRGRGVFFTDRMALGNKDKEIHHARLFFHAAGKSGGPPPENLPEPELEISQAWPEDLRNPPQGVKYMTVHPGAAYGPAKRWPVEQFRDFLLMVLEQVEIAIVALGVESEKELAEELLGDLPAERSLNLAGKTTLRQCMEVLAGSELMVANDSGLMHLAAGLDTPTVGIFGSTSPELTRPLGKAVEVLNEPVDCSPCFQPRCPRERDEYRCLRNISPEQVFNVAKKYLAGVLNDD